MLQWLIGWIEDQVYKGGDDTILEDDGAYYQAVNGGVVMCEVYMDQEHDHEVYSIDIWGVLRMEIALDSGVTSVSVGLMRFNDMCVYRGEEQVYA